MPVPIWAGRYIGLPFAEHGRDRAGLDCWGLVRLVMGEQFAVALPGFNADYKNTSDCDGIAALVEREAMFWRDIPSGAERLGDVIVLRLKGKPVHVGLVLGDGQMLHVEQGVDSAIEKYTTPRWKDRIHGFYRYEPFDEQAAYIP